MKRDRLLIGVLVLAAILALATACGPDKVAPAAAAPPEVFVMAVVVQDVPVIGEWVGETRGRADIVIRARVQGFLEGIHFREGSLVQKGKLLYTIDKSELLQELTAAQAGLAASKTELAYARSDVARYRPLAEINAVSERDLDSAVAREEAAVAQVEAAEAILRLAEINLSYSEIKAPITGVIGLTKAKVGDYVGQSPNPVVLNTVSQTDPIHVRFPIGEREYLEVARRFPEIERDNKTPEDSRVPLELVLADGTVHPETGYVVSVERQIDASTGTLTIEAAFPNQKLMLKPGQYGRIRAVIDLIEAAKLVPQRAVQELQGQHQIWIVGDGGAVDLRSVEMGRRVDQLWVVKSGVEPGEQVVVDGIQRLRAGVTVNAQPWQPPELPAEAVTGS